MNIRIRENVPRMHLECTKKYISQAQDICRQTVAVSYSTQLTLLTAKARKVRLYLYIGKLSPKGKVES